MKTWRLIYKVVLLHEFFIEAETENEVGDKFVEMVSEGELDFNYGEVDEGDIYKIEEV